MTGLTDKARFTRPRKLSAADPVTEFNCGREALDTWLARFALVNQQADACSVYVATTNSGAIAGYYALTTGAVLPVEVPNRVAKGLARHPVPVFVLARLAVAQQFQRCGLGRALLRDAIARVEVVSDQIAARALLVVAKDEHAAAFYRDVAQFEPSPTDPLHLFLLVKDIRQALTRGVTGQPILAESDGSLGGEG